jgi:hypothetical protein
VARRRNRRNWPGRIAVAAALVLLVTAFRLASQMRRERLLVNLGGEVSYTQPAGSLADRIKASPNAALAREGPKLLDRLLGKIVAVDFGRLADLSDQPSQAVVRALHEVDTLEVVMIEGLPIADARLLELADLPNLRQLGLKKTKVTAEGVAALKKKRPGLEVQWLDAPQ